jgi:hypothetical protein
MLTNAQKALIKQGQRECGLSDGEYRQVLREVAGAESSKDGKLGDRDFDRVMAYMEAICWQRIDAGASFRGRPRVFVKRGYWKGKNFGGGTSRDRFAARELGADVAALESEARARGLGEAYLAEVRRRAGSDVNYRAALRRTLKGGRLERGAPAREVPF